MVPAIAPIKTRMEAFQVQANATLQQQPISLLAFRGQPLNAQNQWRQHAQKRPRDQQQGRTRSLVLAAAAGAAAAEPPPPQVQQQQQQQQQRSWIAAVGDFAAANFIPVGLVGAICLATLYPVPGVAAARMELNLLATVGIFIISGLNLQRGETLAALRSLPAIAYGLVAILMATPLAAFAVVRLPLQPPEVATGLAVLCCMPTTLSACVALTTAAGGNAAVALLLVVLTNTLAVFTMPLLLSLVLGSGLASAAAFSPAELFRSLVATVLLPLAAGAAAQALPWVTEWRKRNKRLLAYLSAACLCSVPWMQVSKAVAAKLAMGPATLLAAAAAGLGLHLALLAANGLLTPLVRFDPDPQQDVAIRKAVLLCSSQKTLPVAVAVLNQLGPALGAGVGYAVLPCVAAHLLQTVIDSALVARWNATEAAAAARAAKAAA